MYEKSNKAVELKVSGKTHPNKLGWAIAKYLKDVPMVYLTAMGEASVNAAVKSIIVAQSFAAYESNEIVIKIGFDTRFDQDLAKEVTIIVFYLTLQKRQGV
jgi:stage V sporulation protein SpoVS